MSPGCRDESSAAVRNPFTGQRSRWGETVCLCSRVASEAPTSASPRNYFTPALPIIQKHLVARQILFWAEIQETIRLKGEDARQMNSQSFKKTIKSGTFRKNTLWNKHLSLHTHFSSIYASIHIFKHLSLHTHSSRLITLIKCLKGHKSSTFHVEQPETLIEWKSESLTDLPKQT